MKYLIDANTLITPFKFYYAFDLAPKFWELLILKGGRNIVFCKPILDEINNQGDDLSIWLNDNIDCFNTIDHMTDIVGINYGEIIDSV